MKPLAITHNSNASKTVIFGSNNDSDGKPYDRDYALRRAHFEPLIEMMQIKGNSEVHRQFWQTDEFSNFEHAGSLAKFSDRTIDQRNFVRWSVIGGLAWEQKLGVNGKLAAVGNTVDLATACYRNSIGAVDLIGSWVDDGFDPAVPALYYARGLRSRRHGGLPLRRSLTACHYLTSCLLPSKSALGRYLSGSVLSLILRLSDLFEQYGSRIG